MLDALDDLLGGLPSAEAVPEWEPFPDDSGTLGIPRASMPQIKSEHRGAMVQYLKGRGITHAQEEVVPSTLKPSQAEYSPAKVEKARGFQGRQRPILVSADDHLLDGHHQWLASLDAPDKPIKAIRLHAPAHQLLVEAARFPSSGVDKASASTLSAQSGGAKLDAQQDELDELLRDVPPLKSAKPVAARPAKTKAPAPVTAPTPGPSRVRGLEGWVASEGFEVTSGYDTDGHNTGSLHGAGWAVDVRTRDRTPEEVEELMSKARAAGFVVRDERTRPAGQAKWDGPHVHLQYDELGKALSDLPDVDELDAALAEVPGDGGAAASGPPPVSEAAQREAPPARLADSDDLRRRAVEYARSFRGAPSFTGVQTVRTRPGTSPKEIDFQAHVQHASQFLPLPEAEAYAREVIELHARRGRHLEGVEDERAFAEKVGREGAAEIEISDAGSQEILRRFLTEKYGDHFAGPSMGAYQPRELRGGTPDPFTGEKPLAASPAERAGFQENMARYAPGLASLNTQEGVKTTAAEEAAYGFTEAATLGLLSPEVDPERYHSERERQTAEKARVVGSALGVIVPFTGAARLVNAARELPALAPALAALEEAGPVGRALSRAHAGASTFGAIEAGREITNIAHGRSEGPGRALMNVARGSALGGLSMGLTPPGSSALRAAGTFGGTSAALDLALGPHPPAFDITGNAVADNALLNVALGLVLHNEAPREVKAEARSVLGRAGLEVRADGGRNLLVNTRTGDAVELATVGAPAAEPVGEVYRFRGRDVVNVRLPDGTIQSFYRSTGQGSKQAGRWFPFDGVKGTPEGLWFDKGRFVTGELESRSHPLHRLGSEEMRAASDDLARMDLPRGREVTEPAELNRLLADQTPPVPESPQTLRAQFQSALDPESPRVAVLVTPGEEIGRVPEGFAAVELGGRDGTLYVRESKAAAMGLSDAGDVRRYVEANGFESLIGKASPVADTSRGAALVTTDAAGRELSSSIVTSREAAEAQRATDAAQFPQAARSELMPAQEAAARRAAGVPDARPSGVSGEPLSHARERAAYHAAEAERATDPARKANAQALADEYAAEAARLEAGAEGPPPAGGYDLSDPARRPSLLRRAGREVVGVLQLPKALRASFDWSATGRQALPQVLARPRFLKRMLAAQRRATVSQAEFDTFVGSIVNHPDYELMRRSGLFLSSPGGVSEEVFASAFSKRIPGVKQSDRAYSAALDSVRVQAWDLYARQLKADPATTSETWKAAAELINISTGRGVVPVLDRFELGRKIVRVLNVPFFSPRNMAAKFNLISPRRVVANALNPETRPVAKIQLREAIRGTATLGVTLGLLDLIPGVDVGYNPWGRDFGKLRVGKTRFDLSGGMSYTVRTLAQMADSAAQLARGREVDERKQPAAIAKRFLRSQLSPTAAAVVDWKTGETFEGDEFTYTGAAADLVVPFIVADAIEGFREEGLLGAAKTAPSFFGVGVKTYDDEGREARRASKRAEDARAMTDKVLERSPAVRDELRRRGIFLRESDAPRADEITRAVERAAAEPGYVGLKDADKRKRLLNVVEVARERAAGGADALKVERREEKIARRLEGSKDEERVKMAGEAGKELERLGVPLDPVFGGYKVGSVADTSVGFKGEHAGQGPEHLAAWRRRVAEEVGKVVDRAMAEPGYRQGDDNYRRRRLLVVVREAARRVGNEGRRLTRGREWQALDDVRRYQRVLEGRTPAGGPHFRL